MEHVGLGRCAGRLFPSIGAPQWLAGGGLLATLPLERIWGASRCYTHAYAPTAGAHHRLAKRLEPKTLPALQGRRNLHLRRRPRILERQTAEEHLPTSLDQGGHL